MGLLVGILIGAFCRRFGTALVWCLGFALLAAAFLTLGASSDAGMAFAGKAAIAGLGFLVTLGFLFAGAAGTIGVKRLVARRKASASQAEVFGPAPAPAERPVSGA